MKRLGIAALTAASLVAAPVWAEPAPRPLSEAIEVSESACLKRAELISSVETWLGRSAIDPSIRIQVDETEPGHPRFVVLREGRPATERRFRGGNIACPDLRAAVALAMALAIDATILQAVLEPVPAEVEPPKVEPPTIQPPKPEPKPKPKPKPKPEPEPEATTPVSGEAAAIVLLGVLPAPAFGGSLGAIVPIGTFSLRIAAWATAATELSLGKGDARVGMVAGEISGCLARDLGALRVRGCAGAAGGGWSAEGSGYDANRVAVIPWFAATAGFGLEVPLSDALALVSRLNGYAPITRPTLEVSAPDDEPVAREEAPPGGISVSLGAMVGFP